MSLRESKKLFPGYRYSEMAPLRKKQALRRKRIVRRRSGFKTNNNLRSLNPIAQRYICKMKYAETITTGTSGVIQMSLNSIYDPNITGGGHQPYGHDTFATMYNRYRVISCSYRIVANKNNDTLQVVALPSNEPLTYLTAAEYKENPRCRYATQSPGGEAKFVSGLVSIPSLTGRTKSQYMADDRYQAQFGASPLEAAVLNLGVFSGSDTPTNGVPLNIELVYTVECFDVKHLAQS